MRLPTVTELKLDLANARKAVVSVVGLAGVLVSTGLLHGQLAAAVTGAVALLTAVGVYRAPNSPVTDTGPGFSVPLDTPPPVPVAAPVPPAAPTA